ncbi:MAG: DUF2064 domain-containing protein [Bacteroidota bacterium]|nr:DUF2064 domain-containing protein [Bacteroidota bacterium]
MELTEQTALLFFSKTASVEAESKCFFESKNRKVNSKISKLLIANSRKTLTQSGLRVFEVSSTEQTGNSFGEKVSNAIESVFLRGFENVIVIGNDCPQLTVFILKAAIAGLTNHQVVIGGDRRGGIYLLGVNKEVFNKKAFINLKWQTPNLFDDISKSLLGDSTFLILPTLKDINNSEDLASLKHILPLTHLLRTFVLSLLASFLKNIYISLSGYRSTFSFIKGLRAPPLN